MEDSKAAGDALRAALDVLVARGFGNSAGQKLSLDAEGNPVPWITYPAMEYLNGLDLSDKTMFEYGTGCSTIYWAQRCRSIVGVEHDRVWYKLVAQAVSNSHVSNCTLVLREDEGSYLCEIENANCAYDVIIVDGGFNRRKMAERALTRLAPGGCIILDNSDCHVKAAEVLRNSGLIQVDFTGFAPGNQHEQATSIFLHRDFNFKSKERWQPRKTLWCMRHYVDE